MCNWCSNPKPTEPSDLNMWQNALRDSLCYVQGVLKSLSFHCPVHMQLAHLLFLTTYAYAQSNAIIRSTNSVDVQLCVQTAFLTPQRDAFLQALTNYMTQSLLNSNALYLDRQYTTTEGALCYLFVYQGTSPDNAQLVVERLAEQQTLTIPFATTTIECGVMAAQWSGDNLSYLGAPMPPLWTVNDLLLWGSCMMVVLFFCMSGMCCYAFCLLRHHSPGQHLQHAPPTMTMKLPPHTVKPKNNQA